MVVSNRTIVNKRVSSSKPSVPALRTFERRSVTVGPDEIRCIGLGAYDISMPVPTFDLTLDPDVRGKVDASFEYQDIPGSQRYLVLCRLQNDSGRRCHVSVRRRTVQLADDPKERT